MPNPDLSQLRAAVQLRDRCRAAALAGHERAELIREDGRIATPELQPWHLSWRADPRALPLADRHYNRQKVGSPQFVPPGRCLVLLTESAEALWVTSWPFAEFVKHDWAGAMVNSLFRREDGPIASDLIVAAAAATRAHWPAISPMGMVSFVDPDKTRRKRDPGRCYRKAGWTNVGFTAAGLHVFQIRPEDFPPPLPARPRFTHQQALFDLPAIQPLCTEAAGGTP